MTVLAALRTELLFVRPPRQRLGVGGHRWPSVAARFRRQPPSAVLLIGFSGGLRADLLPGDVVLASEVLGNGRFRPHDALLERGRAALPEARLGPVCTVSTILKAQDKARLGLEALAADMESARLIPELEAMGIPWLVLRVVLDALWEDLPGRIGQAGWAARGLACARRLGTLTRQVAPSFVEAAA